MKVYLVIFIAVGILATITFCEACPHPIPAADVNRETREALYRLIESIGPDSASAQIYALQGFVEQYPDFELAYTKLLERYLFYDRINAAKVYFQKLSASPQNYRNSSWMLARIALLQDDPMTAFRAFSQALHPGSLSFDLLKDFIEFDHQQSGKFNGVELFREMRLSREKQKLVSAFLSYQKSDYKWVTKIFQELPPDVSHNLIILYFWGQSCVRLLRYVEADSIWYIGLSLARTKGDREAEAQFLSSLGYRYYLFDEYKLALSYFDSAGVIARRTNDLHRIQWLTGYCAYIHKERGEYAEATEKFKEAIKISLKIGAHSYIADWSRGLAETFSYLGQYDAALAIYGRAEEYAYKANKAESLVNVKISIGNCYVSLKQTALAKKVFQEAYNLAKLKELTYQQYNAKAKLGLVFHLEGKYDKARSCYKEFIDFLEKKNSRQLASEFIERVAKTYALEGRYVLAKQKYQQAYQYAKAAGIKTFEGWYLLRIAEIETIQGQIAPAIVKCKLVQEIAAAEKNTELLWEALLGHGNACQKSNDLNAAISIYKQAAEIIETSRKSLQVEQLRIGYFIEGSQVYQKLVHCYLQRYEQSGFRTDLDSLFYYEAMGRSRALQDLKPQKDSASSSREYLEAQRQLQTLQRRLRAEAEKSRSAEEWNDLLSQLEAARYSLITQRLRMVGNDTAAEKSQERFQPPSLSAVLSDLKQTGAGLLLYHLSPENSFTLAATGEQVKVVRLQCSLSALAVAIDSLMAPFHHVTGDSVQYTAFRAAIAHRLFQWLVAPVEKVIKLPSQVTIVPDVKLAALPFDLLLLAAPNKAEYTPGDFPDYAEKFLAQRYALAYNPRIALLHARPEKIAKRSEVLVFANPFAGQRQTAFKQNQLRDRTGWRFEPLPFAEFEAKKIQEIRSGTQILKRENATKAAFRNEAPQHRIVHIASHAFVDTVYDAFSGLVLAAGSDSTDDGMLMGYEISDLDLHCDLMSLIACETGRGQQVAGEGVLGLPRLFLSAGVKTVLMTLWKVDDKFAADLMPRFYAGLFEQGLSKAEALRQAKLAMLKQSSVENDVYRQHPFYWAAYTLYGNPAPLQKSMSYTVKAGLVLILIVSVIGTVVFYRLRHFH